MSQEEEATCVVGEDRLTCIPGSPLFGSLYGWSDPAVLKAEMAKFVGPDNVIVDAEALEAYARDLSFSRPGWASCAVFVQNTEQIQSVVKWANEHFVPITAHSSGVGFYGAAIPSQGGILMDLSRMKAILKIDTPDKRALIEPGVTFEELCPALASEGVQFCNPLLPHRKKSVLTSAMEREPLLIPKSEYSETLLTSGLILADGQLLRTGSSLGVGMTSGIYPDGLYPGSQLYKGSQGTLAIAAWANVKVEWLPKLDKVFFVAFDSYEGVPECVYPILRKEIGRECLVLSRANLATILADQWPADFDALSGSLPAYTLILCVSGLNRLPEERVAYQEEALREVASRVGFKLERTVGGVGNLDRTVLALLRGPWIKSDIYWKHLRRGGSFEIFFYTTLDKSPAFIDAVQELATRSGYPTSDIGVYVQPMEYGRACYVHFNLPCDPRSESDAESVRRLFLSASEKCMDMGGLFTAPYGSWADMVYSRAASYTATLKVVKNAFDPNNILNPGKLCF